MNYDKCGRAIGCACAHGRCIRSLCAASGMVQCGICLEEEDGFDELGIISGCAHAFCFPCIHRWSETENRCPTCRARFITIVRKRVAASSPTSCGSDGDGSEGEGRLCDSGRRAVGAERADSVVGGSREGRAAAVPRTRKRARVEEVLEETVVIQDRVQVNWVCR